MPDAAKDRLIGPYALLRDAPGVLAQHVEPSAQPLDVLADRHPRWRPEAVTSREKTRNLLLDPADAIPNRVPVVSRETLPHIANSDFHRPEHLFAWKTLLSAEKTGAGVLEALRRGTGIGVLRLTPDAAVATA